MHRMQICFLLSVILTSNAYSLTGSGNEADPYRIRSFSDFNVIRTESDYWDKHIRLECDIDLDPNLPGREVYVQGIIAPDGSSTFTGTFDGNGYRLRKVIIDTASADNYFLGIFGEVGSNALIKNLYIEECQIYARNKHHFLGVLVGLNRGTIIDCQSNGSIVAGDDSWRVGGLAGSNAGTIEYSSSKVDVTAGDGCKFLGGLVGSNTGSIIGSFAASNIVGGMQSYYCGGLVGKNDQGNITDCYAGGLIRCENNAWQLGGLIGSNQGDVTGCYSRGSLEGGSQSREIGGLIGHVNNHYSSGFQSNIINCYSIASIVAGEGSRNLGGMVGYILDGEATDCYAAGNIIAGVDSSLVAGFVGSRSFGVSFSGCLWDMEASGMNVGVAMGSVFGVVGKTTEEMQRKITYSHEWWDFVNTWKICEETNYPRFFWQISQTDWVCPDGIGLEDFSFLAEHWSSDNCAATNNCSGTDLDTSGTIDIQDLLIYCKSWINDE